jgi:hypothetical protein
MSSNHHPPFTAILSFYQPQHQPNASIGRGMLILENIEILSNNNQLQSLLSNNNISIFKCSLSSIICQPELLNHKINITDYRIVPMRISNKKNQIMELSNHKICSSHYIEIQSCNELTSTTTTNNSNNNKRIRQDTNNQIIMTTLTGQLTCASPELCYPITNQEYWIGILNDSTTILFIGSDLVKYRWLLDIGKYYEFQGNFEPIPEFYFDHTLKFGPTYRLMTNILMISSLTKNDDSTTISSPTTISIPQSPFTTNTYSYEGEISRIRHHEWIIELDNSTIKIWLLHTPLPSRVLLGVRTGARVRFNSIATMYVGGIFQGFCTTLRSDIAVIQYSLLEEEQEPYIPIQIQKEPITEYLLSLTCPGAMFAMESLTTMFGIKYFRHQHHHHHHQGKKSSSKIIKRQQQVLIHQFKQLFPSFLTFARIEQVNFLDPNREFLLDWNMYCPIHTPCLERVMSFYDVIKIALSKVKLHVQHQEMISTHVIDSKGLCKGFDVRLFASRLPFTSMDDQIIELQDETALPLFANNVSPCILFGRIEQHHHHHQSIPFIGHKLVISHFQIIIERFGNAAWPIHEFDIRRNLFSKEHEYAGIISRGADLIGITRVYLKIFEYQDVQVVFNNDNASNLVHQQQLQQLTVPVIEQREIWSQLLRDTTITTATTPPPTSLSTLFNPTLTHLPNPTTYSGELIIVVESSQLRYHSNQQQQQQDNYKNNTNSHQQQRIPLLDCASIILTGRDLSSPLSIEIYISIGKSHFIDIGLVTPTTFPTILSISPYTIYYSSKRGRPYIKCNANEKLRLLVLGGSDNSSILSTYKQFPQDLNQLPIISLTEFRKKMPLRFGSCGCVMASVISVVKIWFEWKCPICTVGNGCGNPIHANRQLSVGTFVDIDDGTDICCCYASNECAMKLVGLDIEKTKDRVRGLDRIEWNKYAQVFVRECPQGDLTQDIANASTIRTCERRIFIERDRPPVSPQPIYDTGPSQFAVDQQQIEEDAQDLVQDEDHQTTTIQQQHRTISIKIKGGKMKVPLSFEKLAAKVLFVL